MRRREGAKHQTLLGGPTGKRAPFNPLKLPIDKCSAAGAPTNEAAVSRMQMSRFGIIIHLRAPENTLYVRGKVRFLREKSFHFSIGFSRGAPFAVSFPSGPLDGEGAVGENTRD